MKICCFGCSSSKEEPRKHPKEVNREWGKNEGILTDPSTFSLKEQKRKLKAAKQEEVEVSREAARVVNWVKQASARMDVDEMLLDEDAAKYK